MYPQAELTILSARKEILRLRIATRRIQTARDGATLAAPLAWIDQALGRWRALSPVTRLVGAPVGLFLLRTLLRRFGKGRWAVVAQAIRTAMRAAQMFR